jgi:hypothetical protein
MGLKPREEMTRPRANSLLKPDKITFHVEEDVKEKLRLLAEREARSLDAYVRMLATEHVKAQTERGIV